MLIAIKNEPLPLLLLSAQNLSYIMKKYPTVKTV